jgi:nucleoside-diphosphate-sugar epimerase
MSSVKPSSTVLVTGADGFIGSHLRKELVRKGFKVCAFAYHNSLNSWGWLDQYSKDVKGQFGVFAGDIRDPHRVKEAMKSCDSVLHLAALIAIPFSYLSPDSYGDTNMKGNLNVWQAARELGVTRVVHASTSEVYGTDRFVPITEIHPLQRQSAYSASKNMVFNLTRPLNLCERKSFLSEFSIPLIIVSPKEPLEIDSEFDFQIAEALI